jgi:16S rRNA (guanine527-N7)-methyltransferase
VRPPREALAQGASSVLGRPLTSHELDLFSRYLALLLKWQRSHRLIGSSDEMWIVEHLFLDSLLFLRLLPSTTRTLVDIGSGAGMPGVPIKIVRTDVEVTLVESRRRRASFLSAVVRELDLNQVSVVADRIERRLTEMEGRFDAVVMRCAGDVGELMPLAGRLLAPQGLVIASGPPEPRPLNQGEWVVVPGLRSSSTRRFAVYRATAAGG